MRFSRKAAVLAFALALSACATAPKQIETNTPTNATKIGDISFTKIGFDELPHWLETDVDAARLALKRSCTQTMALAPDAPLSVRGTYAGKAKDWAKVCENAANSQIESRDFWQNGFTPYRISAASGDFGRLTSYYEPVVDASLTPTETFNEPLFAKPKDLVTIELGPFDGTLAGKKSWAAMWMVSLRPTQPAPKSIQIMPPQLPMPKSATL